MNFQYYFTYSKPINNTFEKGRVQILIEKYLKNNFSGDFYLCGIPKMIEDVKKLLKNRGFKNIYYEIYWLSIN